MTLSTRVSKNLLYDLTKTWRPLHYQGGNQTSRYFEGWYFKNVSADGDHIWSIIPGISIADKTNRHSFIQLINGKTAETWYIEYPLEDFSYSKLDFEFRIGDNKFGYRGMVLDIDDPGITAKGHIAFSKLKKLKSTPLNPGIMGWYSFVPFMECYHGLVSADHDLKGSLSINNSTMNFSGGKGYSEKDWGRSMPSSWIWMQSNHFEENGTSLMLSIARIPWMLSSFTGFLCVLLLDGKIHRFATYTGAKIKRLKVSDDAVTAVIADKKYTLTINARHSGRGILVAPLDGAMDRRIAESVDAIIELSVTDKKGKTVFSGSGINAGLELVGERSELPV